MNTTTQLPKSLTLEQLLVPFWLQAVEADGRATGELAQASSPATALGLSHSLIRAERNAGETVFRQDDRPNKKKPGGEEQQANPHFFD